MYGTVKKKEIDVAQMHNDVAQMRNDVAGWHGTIENAHEWVIGQAQNVEEANKFREKTNKKVKMLLVWNVILTVVFILMLAVK